MLKLQIFSSDAEANWIACVKDKLGGCFRHNRFMCWDEDEKNSNMEVAGKRVIK